MVVAADHRRDAAGRHVADPGTRIGPGAVHLYAVLGGPREIVSARRPFEAAPPVTRASGAVWGAPAQPAPAVGGWDERLYRVHFSDVVAFMKSQPLSFWLICLYLFFEYVRPQQIYQPLEKIPFTLITCISCVIAMLAEGRWFRVRSPANGLLLTFSAIVVLSSVF